VDDQHSLALFLRACETSSPLRLEVTDTRTGTVQPMAFPRPYVVIGREEGAGLVLNDPQISRRHAYLQVVRGRIFCVDLASRTGIRWGTAPGRAGWLARDQPLGVGPYEVRPSDEPEGPAPLQTPLPAIDLELWEGPVRRAQWQVERVLALVGRSSACNLQLGNPEVPRFLCGLLRTALGAWVIDLEGAGLTVSGARVPFARIGDGDELRAGPYAIRFRYTPDAPAWPESASEPEPLAAGGAVVDAPDRALAVRAPEAAEAVLLQLRDQFNQAPPGSPADPLAQPMMLMMAQAFGALFREQMSLVHEELARIRDLTREMEELRARLEATAAARASAPPTPSAAGRLVPPAPAPAHAPAGPEPPPPEAPEDLDQMHALLTRRIAAFQAERDTRWQKLLGTLLGRAPGR
jgi:predicted component of type VI protein secretion system